MLKQKIEAGLRRTLFVSLLVAMVIGGFGKSFGFFIGTFALGVILGILFIAYAYGQEIIDDA